MAKHSYLPNPLRKRVIGSRWLRRVLWAIELGMVGLLWGVARLLPLDRASELGAAVMQRLGPRLSRSNQIRENLRVALPEAGESELDRLVAGVWSGFGAMFFETPRLAQIAADADRRLEIVVADGVHAGRTNIFVTAHVANWQVATLAAARLGHPLTALYAHLSNPWISHWFQRARRSPGCEFVERSQGLRPLLTALSAKRSLGLVVDFRVDDGPAIPFFGVPTPTSVLPARLALRYGCDLVPVRVERLGGARFRVTLEDPIRPDESVTDPREQAARMMRAVNARFEDWIRARPEQWLCITRRWPKPKHRRKATPRPVERGAASETTPSEGAAATPTQRR